METQSLQNEISRIKRLLTAAFVCTVCVASAGIVFFHFKTQEKLAESYMLASRNSILIGDYRQAISSLTPAVETGFSSVAILNFNQLPIAQIPSADAVRGDQRRLLSAQIKESIFAREDEKENVAQAIFYYSLLPPLLTCLFFSVIAYAVFYLLSKYSRSKIVRQHDVLLRQRELETVSIVASQVAHDIRSPLGAINMVLSTVDASLEAKQIMGEAVKRINDIANDLIKTRASVRHNGEGLGDETPKSVSLKRILASIIAEKTAEFSEKCIIASDIDEISSVQVNVDESIFTRSISNLLNNAIEAIDKSEPEITLHARKFPTTVMIVIGDNGKGIPEEILGRLGSRGITGHTRISSMGSGSGLGVWYAKSSIESFGGNVSFSSKVGIGTHVTITLPINS